MSTSIQTPLSCAFELTSYNCAFEHDVFFENVSPLLRCARELRRDEQCERVLQDACEMLMRGESVRVHPSFDCQLPVSALNCRPTVHPQILVSIACPNGTYDAT